MTKIGVVGNGVVGGAMARCWMEHASVRIYDKDPARRTHSIVEALEGDVVFVCLPTPRARQGLAADLTAVDGFFKEHRGTTFNFVLRSTVPVGTTARLRKEYDLPNLVHSPEFLTARAAAVDAQTPSRNIIGGEECRCFTTLRQLYRERFPGITTHLMSSDESEAVKLILNAFFAVKVGFFNEARQLCDSYGMDWDVVLRGVLSDGRIAYSHTRVPGPDGRRGWGGDCLPKDLCSFMDCLDRAGGKAMITLAAHLRNGMDRESTWKT